MSKYVPLHNTLLVSLCPESHARPSEQLYGEHLSDTRIGSTVFRGSGITANHSGDSGRCSCHEITVTICLPDWVRCSPGLEYRGGVDVCNSFCRDQLYVSTGCFPGVVQGCACADNELKTDDGLCSSVEECTCYEPSRGVVHQAGDVVSSGCSKW